MPNIHPRTQEQAITFTILRIGSLPARAVWMRCGERWLPLMLILAVLTASRGAAETPDSLLVIAAYNRLLAAAESAAPKDCLWPPDIRLIDDTLVQATAYAEQSRGTGVIVPHITLHAGIFARLLRGNPDAVAFVIAHELAHIVLRQVIARPKSVKTEFVRATYSRAQEMGADSTGLRLAVAAGFSRSAILKGLRRFAEDPRLEYSLYESLQADHPPWKERIAALDSSRAPLWKSMCAFENGAVFLATEQYAAAEACFRSVTEEYPDCSEAWVDLGYALLMQYCDELEPADLRRLGIGHLMAGGFYRRAASLEGKLRGMDRQKWTAAVAALEEALRLNGDLALAKGNLGIAWLVHPGGGEAAKAAEYFSEALALADSSRIVDPRARCALLVNAGVAALEGGNADRSQELLARAEGAISRITPEPRRRMRINPQPALLYNRALIQASSRTPEGNREAEQLFLEYLESSAPTSLWWEEAYDRYARLCREKGEAPRPKDELRAAAATLHRSTVSVRLRGGASLSLTEPLEDALALLGDAAPIPVAAGTNLVKLSFPAQGIDLLADDRILAIMLRSRRSPEAIVAETGLGGGKQTLRVGMPAAEVDRIFQPEAPESVPLLSTEDTYLYYRSAGIALKIAAGAVEEIVIVQVGK